jgi:hypothetical protein
LAQAKNTTRSQSIFTVFRINSYTENGVW